MSSTTYVPQAHIAVTIKSPILNEIDKDLGEFLFGPHTIVLANEQVVWIAGDHNLVGLCDEITLVGGTYGLGGECVLSVPASWCSYLDEEDAEDLVKMMDADQRLMGYALG